MPCDAASLPPKHLLFPKVRLEDAQYVGNLGTHKCRWDRSNRDFQDGEEVTQEEEGKTMEDAVQEEAHRELYNPSRKTLNLRNMRPSQVKNNPRVVLSKPRHQKEEHEFATRNTMIKKEYR